MSDEHYIPAARWHWLTPLFDPVISLTMREGRLRGMVVDEVLAGDPKTVLDLGCGTGTLLLRLARAAPDSCLIGLDPDPDVLRRAREKTHAAGATIELVEGMGDAIPFDDASVDCVVSSLVFHHLAADVKARTLAEARRVLRPEGRLVVMDYGRPQDPLMRVAFLSVQLLDGFASTSSNVRGELPSLIAAAGFDARTVGRLRTVSGSLELLAAMPARGHERTVVSSAAQQTVSR